MYKKQECVYIAYKVKNSNYKHADIAETTWMTLLYIFSFLVNLASYVTDIEFFSLKKCLSIEIAWDTKFSWLLINKVQIEWKYNIQFKMFFSNQETES